MWVGICLSKLQGYKTSICIWTIWLGSLFSQGQKQTFLDLSPPKAEIEQAQTGYAVEIATFISWLCESVDH